MHEILITVPITTKFSSLVCIQLSSGDVYLNVPHNTRNLNSNFVKTLKTHYSFYFWHLTLTLLISSFFVTSNFGIVFHSSRSFYHFCWFLLPNHSQSQIVSFIFISIILDLDVLAPAWFTLTILLIIAWLQDTFTHAVLSYLPTYCVQKPYGNIFSLQHQV